MSEKEEGSRWSDCEATTVNVLTQKTTGVVCIVAAPVSSLPPGVDHPLCSTFAMPLALYRCQVVRVEEAKAKYCSSSLAAISGVKVAMMLL